MYERAESIQTYQEDTSAQERIQSWGVSWNIAKDRPLTGAGYEFEYAPDESRWLSYANSLVPGSENRARAAHSSYFQVLGQHGFVAFGMFVLMLIWSLLSVRKLQKKARARPDTSWIGNYASAIEIGLYGYLIAGAFINVAYFDLLYLYIAMIAILQRELATSADRLANFASEASREDRIAVSGTSLTPNHFRGK